MRSNASQGACAENSGEKKKTTAFRKKQLIFIWGSIALPILSWLVFFLYLNLSSFVQAFQDQFGNWSTSNFEKFFKSISNQDASDNYLFISIKNTFKFFLLNVLYGLPLQILVSYFLFKKIFGYKMFRIIFYFPVIISATVMTGVFKEFINPKGPLGAIFELFGAQPISGLLVMPATATKTVMVYTMLTSVGLYMLLICGAMSRIPLEVLESGRLDGVGSTRELFNIILPMIWPTLSTLLVLQLTGLLNSSGHILLLVDDPYSSEALTINYWIFEQTLTGQTKMERLGVVSAAGLALSAVTVPIIMFIKWIIVEKIPTVEY